jgi:hypothetical protein
MCPRCGEVTRFSIDESKNGFNLSLMELKLIRRHGDEPFAARGAEIFADGKVIHQCGNDEPANLRPLVISPDEAIQQMDDTEWYFGRGPVGFTVNGEAPAADPHGFVDIGRSSFDSCSFCGRDRATLGCVVTNMLGTTICGTCAARAADALLRRSPSEDDGREIVLPPVVVGEASIPHDVDEVVALFDGPCSPFGDEFLGRFVDDRAVTRANDELRSRWGQGAPFIFFVDRIEFLSVDEAAIAVRLVLRSHDPIVGHAVRTPAGWRLQPDVMEVLARMGGINPLL